MDYMDVVRSAVCNIGFKLTAAETPRNTDGHCTLSQIIVIILFIMVKT